MFFSMFGVNKDAFVRCSEGYGTEKRNVFVL